MFRFTKSNYDPNNTWKTVPMKLSERSLPLKMTSSSHNFWCISKQTQHVISNMPIEAQIRTTTSLMDWSASDGLLEGHLGCGNSVSTLDDEMSDCDSMECDIRSNHIVELCELHNRVISNDERMWKELVADNFCTICLNLFIVPMSLPCGHSFCEYCLSQYLQRNQLMTYFYVAETEFRCPNCNQLVDTRLIVKNTTLALEISHKLADIDTDYEEKREWLETAQTYTSAMTTTLIQSDQQRSSVLPYAHIPIPTTAVRETPPNQTDELSDYQTGFVEGALTVVVGIVTVIGMMWLHNRR